MLDSRDVLATVDKLLTVVLEPIGNGKIRVRTSSWDQEAVILESEVLEAVALGKSLRLVRAPRPLESTSRPDCQRRMRPGGLTLSLCYTATPMV